MSEQKDVGVEYHEDPYFNGQYHRAVWVKSWASQNTDSEPPPGAPTVCAVCGKSKGISDE